MSSEARLPSNKLLKWKDLEHPSIYANVMGIGMTPFDISVQLGEVGESTETEVFGTPKVRIILTPEQAANLCKLLAIALKTYTENNGPLRKAGAIDVGEITAQIDEQIQRQGVPNEG